MSSILVVPKKNGKIRVCVDYRKLNVVTITYAFPLPFTDSVLLRTMTCIVSWMALADTIKYAYTGRPREDCVRHGLGSVRRCGIDVRLEDGTCHLLTDDYRDFRGIYTCFYANVSR